jgi:hypothetical protein
MARFPFELNKTVSKGDDRVIKLIFDTTVHEWEFFYTAKKNYSYTDEQADLKVNPSQVAYYASALDYTNIIEIPLDSTATNIEPTNYINDIKVIKPNEKKHTIATGKLTIEAHVTIRNTE